jgi:predicted DNA-binding transcriptional regulator YafY
VGWCFELQPLTPGATFSSVNQAARLHRLLVILSMSTARPGIRAVDLADSLKVSTRTVFRDLAELHRLGFPVTFGNGYPAQQELFRRRKRQEMSQIMADLVDQQLEVVRRKLPADEAERVVNDAIQYLPMEAAEAVTRALAKAARH